MYACQHLSSLASKQFREGFVTTERPREAIPGIKHSQAEEVVTTVCFAVHFLQLEWVTSSCPVIVNLGEILVNSIVPMSVFVHFYHITSGSAIL